MCYTVLCIVIRAVSITVKLELSDKEFRRLLDMVYIGNWVLNSNRDGDRLADYDRFESLIFSHCRDNGADALADADENGFYPSEAFQQGGIHEAIFDYEDCVFYDKLAEELAHRDMGYVEITDDNYPELCVRVKEYIDEFESNGLDNFNLEI